MEPSPHSVLTQSVEKCTEYREDHFMVTSKLGVITDQYHRKSGLPTYYYEISLVHKFKGIYPNG
jgi:hypothetical protein